jgi:hypothetical protein
MRADNSIRAGLAFLVLGASARSEVLVVSSSGGGQFTNLQSAVNAAQEGDTLLVKPGAYSSFTIDGESLTVAADTGGPVTVYGSVVVRDLSAAQQVVLSGLVVTGATTTSMADAPGAGLVVTGNAGAVRVESCRFEGAIGYGDGWSVDAQDCCTQDHHHWGWEGAILDANSGGVAFVGCTFVGGRGSDAQLYCYCGEGGPGGDALRLSGGLAALYDCDLVGGRGGSNGWAGGPGGAGIRLLASTLCGVFASGSTFQGANGGDGYDFVYSEGGAGGDGVVLGTGTIAQFLECTSAGGMGGLACGHVFPPGPDGVPQSGSGTAFTFPVPRLVLESPSLVREGVDFPLTVRGRPGDVVNLYFGTRTAFRATAMWRGVLLARATFAPGQGHLVGILGPIPASGVLTASFRLPPLGEGIEADDWFLQAWRDSPVDGRALGSFAAVTVLDPAF